MIPETSDASSDSSAVRRGLFGAAVGLAWLGGLFAVEPLIGSFGIVSIAEAIIVRSPGWLSTLAVSLLGFYAIPLLVASVCVASVVAAAAVAVAWPVRSHPTASVTAGSALVTLPLFFFAGATLSVGFVAGVLIAVALPSLAAYGLPIAFSIGNDGSSDRRRFLRRVGGLSIVSAVSIGALRALLVRLAGPPLSERVREPLERSITPPTGDIAFDFDGMPAAVTPPEEHYVVDINVNPPRIDPEAWTLDVGGAVEQPYSLTYDEMLDHGSSVEQTTTMVCISNRVGGELIGTGHWSGVQLSDLVEAAVPSESAVDVVTHAADGYSEAIPIDIVEREDILIAYGLGNRTLSAEHGFPARLLVPGRYGMKMTKWIDRIEVRNEEHEAYWEGRGWDEEAVVNTMSYVRGAERNGDQVVVGGIAFGGLETGVEEIERVEVSVDGDETWAEAELEPQFAAHAWRRWRYEFYAPEGREFDVVVRAIERDGTVQTETETDPRPNGSTGWHRRTVRVA